MKMVDYDCHSCEIRFETLVSKAQENDVVCIRCEGEVIKRFPAPKLSVPQISFDRGKSDERPPWAMDTRALGEGQSYSSWIKERRAKRKNERVDEILKDHWQKKSFSG